MIFFTIRDLLIVGNTNAQKNSGQVDKHNGKKSNWGYVWG